MVDYTYIGQDDFILEAFERILDDVVIFALLENSHFDGTDATLTFSQELTAGQETDVDTAMAAIDADAVQWEIIRSIRDVMCDAFIWRIQRWDRFDYLIKEQIDDLGDLHNYMQALADIPETEIDPFDITWPTPP